MSHWRTKRDRTTSWHWHWWAGRRVQFTLHVHRHAHPGSDRWVFQPSVTYDRKERTA